MKTHPFFAILLMYLKFVAVPGMKKISTNGYCIFFSPDFAEKLYEHELDYILCHQIMHIICGHIWRPFDRKGDDYHFACDIQINSLLAKSGFDEDRYAHLGYIYRTVPHKNSEPSSLTPEEICQSLPYSLYVFDDKTRSKFLPDNDLYWDQQEDSCCIGEIILDLPDLDGLLNCAAKSEPIGSFRGKSGTLQQHWKLRVVSAIASFGKGKNTNSSGNIPEFAKRMIEKSKNPTIDWKKVLCNFVQERICDYSFSPPDRRFSDTPFFLPDFNEKDFISKEILFMVDTSGSVSDEELATVYSEVRGALEQFGGKLNGKLGFFDATITSPIPFGSINDLLRIIPYGGGGTDFRIIFDYIRKNCTNELPACIVIFTDGYGPYPDESKTMNIPVLWIINNLKITPPFGKTTRIIPELTEPLYS